MSGRDIIVVGSSAGGLQAMVTIVEGLPPDLPAAIFLVMHTSRDNGGSLPSILAKAGPLPAQHALQGGRIQRGHIYIAPPDVHLLLEPGRMRLWAGPRENRFRPAVDPLFRSAARTYHQRVIGVVLSGGMNDGTQGLMTIKRHGGIAVVQDPLDAVVPSMPASAIRHVAVDHILAANDIAPLLAKCSIEPMDLLHGNGRKKNGGRVTSASSTVKKAGLSSKPINGFQDPPTALTCPDCGGALWERRDGSLLRFRCHLGHRFTAEALAADQADHLESALFTALRVLKETAALKNKMAKRAEAVALEGMAQAYREQEQAAEHHAAFISQLLLGEELDGEEPAAVVQQPLELETPRGSRQKRAAIKTLAKSKSAPAAKKTTKKTTSSTKEKRARRRSPSGNQE